MDIKETRQHFKKKCVYKTIKPLIYSTLYLDLRDWVN